MTRQWLADPKLMCSQHLTGEHAEAHMFMRKMQKGHSLKGFIEGSMFFGAGFLYTRHNDLALHLGGHATPMELDGKLVTAYPDVPRTQEHVEKSLKDLLTRCYQCNKNYWKFFVLERN